MNQDQRRVLPRTGYPRQRAIAACLTCRERKRKCDNLRPSCSSCQRRGTVCNYAQQDHSTLDHATLRVLDRLSIIEGLVRNIAPATGRTSTTLSAVAREVDQPSVQIWPSDNAAAAREDLRSSNPTIRASGAATDTILQWPVFNGLLALAPRSKYADQHGLEVSSYMNDLDIADDAAAHSSPGSSRSVQAAFNISTEHQDIERLVDRFFWLVNIKNPILGRRVATRYCQRYCEQGPQFDLETCLVLLMCSLGAIAVDFDPDQTLSGPAQNPDRLETLQWEHAYYAAAEKRIGIALSSNNTLAIQCLCLAGVYHMYSLNPLSALRMFRAAAASLQILASTNSPVGPASQLHSSLLWMCNKSEREILAEIPISMPTLRDSSAISSYPPPPQMTDANQDEWHAAEQDSWYFFLSEIALRRMTEQVAEVVNNYIDSELYPNDPAFDTTTTTTTTTDIQDLIPITTEFHHQATTFRSQLPPSISFPDVPAAATTEWQQYSRSRYYRVLELMHRPFLYHTLHRPLHPTTIPLAETCLFNALRYLQHSHPRHRHHGLWLQLRNQLKMASLLVAASKSHAAAQGALHLPEGWQGGIEKTLETFEYWSWEYGPAKRYREVLLTMANAETAVLEEG